MYLERMLNYILFGSWSMQRLSLMAIMAWDLPEEAGGAHNQTDGA